MAPSVVAAVVAVLPIWYLIARTGSVARLVEVLATPATVALTLRSVALAATVTVLAVVIGVAAAWLVARTDLPGARAWQVAMVLPLAIPSYISAFVWLDIAPGLAGFPGAVLVLTLTTFPYVFLPAVAALRRIDPAQEEVAASLGMGRWQVARRVTIPQIRTSVAAGALLVALYVLSDFGAVALMRYEVFTWVIYGAYRSGFDPTRAAVLSILLVLLAAVLVAAEARVRGRCGPGPGPGSPGWAGWCTCGARRCRRSAFLAGVIVLGVGVPAAGDQRMAARGRRGPRRTSASSPRRWWPPSSCRRWRRWRAWPWRCRWACWPRATPVGSAPALERTTYIGHALPGIVVAIAMVYVGVRLLRPMYQERRCSCWPTSCCSCRWPWPRCGRRWSTARCAPRRSRAASASTGGPPCAGSPCRWRHRGSPPVPRWCS